MVSDMPLYTVMYILKSYLTAGNPLETYKLQRKDEICLGVNVWKLYVLGNQQRSSE